MQRKWIFRLIILVVVAGAAYRMYQNRPKVELVHLTGQTMGTIRYSVKYLKDSPENLQKSVDSILVSFNQSLSTYISDSEISILNSTGRLDEPSEMFLDVLTKSQEVYRQTAGAFDPTVGPLVNAWGFGPDKILRAPDSAVVDSLKLLVDFSAITQEGQSVNMETGMYLDFSAIAKGYAVDLVAEFLEAQGISDYMVEIGGEVRVSGVNDEQVPWKIGIEDPIVEQNSQRLLAIIELKDLSMATSGNYRNYYKVGERIIAHTIDPRTGFNTSHTLLSASIFSQDCISADAYATAAMVIGLEESIEMLEANGLEGFLLYMDESGVLRSFVTSGLEAMVSLDKTKN
ncbi:MAG: FAD:protein FMN transferase [Cyclobacteriaceae bacterium]